MTTSEHNVAVVEQAIQAVNDGTVARLATQLFAPEFRRHDLAEALANASGPEGLTDFIQSVRTALPDFRMTILDIFGSGDRVTARWVGSGTHHGEFLGVPASGRTIEWNATSIYRLVDGKITDSWQLIDAWGILRKMGATDTDPG